MIPSFCLIDDHTSTNIYNENLLRRVFENAEICMFESGEDFKSYALKAINTFTDRRKVIFLDLNLEQMSAFEILDDLESIDFDFPENIEIFLLTSDRSLRTKEKLHVYPQLKGMIEKPLTIEKVQQFIPALAVA